MSSTPGAAAVLVKASGHVYAERNGTRISLAEGDGVQSSDILITDASSTAEVRFADGATATLSPGTTLELKNFVFGEGQEPSFVLNLVEGTMRSISGEVVKQNPEAFKIVTPRATVGIRGTELFNSVQGSDEVHAVLHIGKGHIVLVTGADGQNITLDSALQAVSMNDGTAGKMVMQTFSPQQMQDLIQQLAPSQLQKSLPGPNGPAGSNGPDASDGQSGEAQPGAEGQAAQAAGGSVSTVVLVVEAETSAGSGAEQVLTQTASNTLISIVETLQGGLADAGFTVESVVAGANSGEYQSLVSPGGGTASAIDPIPNPDPVPPTPSTPDPVPPMPPAPDPVPPTPPTPDPDPPAPSPVYVITADQLSDWAASHLDDHGPDIGLNLTVNGGVLGVDNVGMNEQSLDSGVMASDTVIINGDIGSAGAGDTYREGVLSGDVMNAGPGPSGSDTPPSLAFGSDNIVVNGSLLEGGFIYGDAKNLDGDHLGNVILGGDSITVTGDVARNAAIYGDAETTANLGPHTGGADVISVGGKLEGEIYGGYGGDTITVGTLEGGIIYGGEGNDEIVVNGSALYNGSIFGEDGDDTITVHGDMKGGDAVFIDGGAGNDTVYITGSLVGNDNGRPGAVSNVDLGAGNNRLTVDGDVTAMNMNSGAGKDAVTIKGTYAGGILSTGAGNDTIVINTLDGKASLNDAVDAGAGDDSITVTMMHGGSLMAGAGRDTLNVGIGHSTAEEPIHIYLGDNRNPSVDDNASDSLTLRYGDASVSSSVQVHGLGAGDTVNLGHGSATGVVMVDENGLLLIRYDLGDGIVHDICLNIAATESTALDVFNSLVANGQVKGHGTITVPDAPPPPDYTITAEDLGDWAASHLDDHGPDVGLKLTVNGGVLGVDNVGMNAQNFVPGSAGSMGSDTVIVNGDISSTGVAETYRDGALSGDAMTTGPGAPGAGNSLTFGSDTITVNGSLLEGGFIYGDAKSADGSNLNQVTFGGDNITVTGDVARNAAIYGDTETTTNLGIHTGGADTISVTGKLEGEIYGGYGGDTITVGTLEGGKIYGGEGNDEITINGSSLYNGSILGEDGDDTITVKGDMKGGDAVLIDGGAGDDTVYITGSLVGNAYGGVGAVSYVDLGEGNNSLTVDGDVTAMNMNSGAGKDAVTIKGTYTGGILGTGAGDDTIVINTLDGKTSQNDAVDAGAGDDSITVTLMHGGSLMAGAGSDTLNVGIGNSTAEEPIHIYLGDSSNPLVDDNASDSLTLRYDDASVSSSVQVHGLGAGDTVNLGHGSATGVVMVDDEGMLFLRYTMDGGAIHTICLNIAATESTALDIFNRLVANGQVTGQGVITLPDAPPPDSLLTEYVISADEASDWAASHLDDHGPEVGLHLTVNGGVLGVNNLAMNAQQLAAGNMGSDTVIVNGDIGSTGTGLSKIDGILSGDAMITGPGTPGAGESLTFGSDQITVNGSLLAGGFIYGDAQSLAGSDLSEVVFGADTIKVTGNVERSAAIYGDTKTATNLGTHTGGVDTISVDGVLLGKIYGGYGGDHITVGSLQGGYVSGGDGDDDITVNGSSLAGGSIFGDAGNDTITVKGDMKGSDLILINGGAGDDTVYITGSFVGNDATRAGSSSSIILGEGNNSLTVDGNATALNVTSEVGKDSVTIKGTFVSGTIKTGWGDDTISIATMDGSAYGGDNVDGGGDNDTITVGVMNGGRIIGGNGQDTLEVGVGNSDSLDPIRIYLDTYEGLTPDDGLRDTLTLKYGDFSGDSNVQVHGLGREDTVDLGHGSFSGRAGVDGENQLLISYLDGTKRHDICLNVTVGAGDTALNVFNQLVANGQVTGYGTIS